MSAQNPPSTDVTCPPWCTREHGPRWHDEDIVHYSAPEELGPLGGGGGLLFARDSIEGGTPARGAQVLLRRRDSEITTYVELIIDDERSAVFDVDAFARAAHAANAWITSVIGRAAG